LNVEIKFDEIGFKTQVWRKPTYTELLLMNYRANCPIAWKSGLITCLLKRARIICSDNQLLLKEIEKLRSIFAQNCYPRWFFDKRLKKFENSMKTDSQNNENVDDYSYVLGLPCYSKLSPKIVLLT